MTPSQRDQTMDAAYYKERVRAEKEKADMDAYLRGDETHFTKDEEEKCQ